MVSKFLALTPSSLLWLRLITRFLLKLKSNLVSVSISCVLRKYQMYMLINEANGLSQYHYQFRLFGW